MATFLTGLTGLAGSSSSLVSSDEELSPSGGLVVTLVALLCTLVTAGDFEAFLVSTCFFFAALLVGGSSSELELSLSSELSFFFGTTLGDFDAFRVQRKGWI